MLDFWREVGRGQQRRGEVAERHGVDWPERAAVAEIGERPLLICRCKPGSKKKAVSLTQRKLETSGKLHYHLAAWLRPARL